MPPISSPIVNAQEITKAFGANPLFENVSFTISDGDRIGLIGPNGSGKSTLLRILAGEVAPDSGEVSFRKRTRLACVEQDSRFESGVTVRSVIESALDRSDVSGFERGARFAETLGRAGFEDVEVRATELSGGWQKRLAIVEALVQNPDILLLDEPSLGLSPLLCTELFRTLARIKEAGVGIFLVEQNAKQSLAIADRGYLLDNGHIVGADTADALAKDPKVQAAYLGE